MFDKRDEGTHDLDPEELAERRAAIADQDQRAARNGHAKATPDLLAGLRDGAWLDQQAFPPLTYAVTGVIPEGSVLLVGPPKIGKSWFVLTVALAAASGGRALGIKVEQRPVLYLALEDGNRRLQDRCRKPLDGDPIPAGFQYLTRVVPTRPIADTIAAWLERQHDAPPLVILDTLGKVMPPAAPGESAYQRDYKIGSMLKELVDERAGMTLLTNHHDRKANSEDFIDSVSGTHGLAGAADTIVVLARSRNEEAGLLKITGRDVPEGEYAVCFEDGHRWQLDGDDLAEAAQHARDARLTDGLGDRSAEVVGYVLKHPQGVTPAQVGAAFGMDPKQASVYLGRAVRKERLRKLGRGLYAPVVPVESVESEGKDPPGYNTPNTFNTPSGDDRALFDLEPEWAPDDPARFTQ
ncbi:MAG TPA: AAA family ATPase [Actinomycetes bacterium]